MRSAASSAASPSSCRSARTFRGSRVSGTPVRTVPRVASVARAGGNTDGGAGAVWLVRSGTLRFDIFAVANLELATAYPLERRLRKSLRPIFFGAPLGRDRPDAAPARRTPTPGGSSACDLSETVPFGDSGCRRCRDSVRNSASGTQNLEYQSFTALGGRPAWADPPGLLRATRAWRGCRLRGVLGSRGGRRPRSGAGSRYPVGELIVQVRGREGVFPPAQDEGRVGDARQIAPAVRAADDLLLLPLETLGADGLGHLPDGGTDLGFLYPVRVEHLREERAPHLVEPSGPGERE